MNGIFMPPMLGPGGLGELPPSMPIYNRSAQAVPHAELDEAMAALERGEFTGDASALMAQFAKTLGGIQRQITSATSGFPIRENLEAPALAMTPVDTPFRNRFPRTPGAGSAIAWRQMTTYGGGYGLTTTVTSGASSATQTVGDTAGMQAGDSLYFATTNAFRIVSSVTNGTTVVLTATISTTTDEVVTKGPYFQPGGDVAAVRSFFAETGAPGVSTTAYASKSASYKLLGVYGSITGFAMATGATFTNQLAQEKTNTLRTLMLKEEHAIVQSSATIVDEPWGDGSTAYGYAGLINSFTTANGVPTDQVQTAVGALTFAHIDQQLTRLYNQGSTGYWIGINAQEALSIKNLMQAAGTGNNVFRVLVDQSNANAGLRVTGYLHPITGEVVDIIVSRFVPAGTMLFGADKISEDGRNVVEMSVLPQVQLPELAPNQQIQGYTLQELAPALTAPQEYPWIATVYEALQLRSARHVAKSTGVTAV